MAPRYALPQSYMKPRTCSTKLKNWIEIFFDVIVDLVIDTCVWDISSLLRTTS
jgi:hypothetical protein